MNQPAKKAILAVSFGTSHEDTRHKTIDAIEKAIADANPGIPVYRAWTSKMIISKLLKTTGEKIYTVSEAMNAMCHDGITDVYVQPTHIINGIENHLMKEDAMEYQDKFHSISFGHPLLTSTEDALETAKIIASEFACPGNDEAVILMGHGSAHDSNFVYAALDYILKAQGHNNIYVGTVEAYPSLPDVLKLLNKNPVKKITLTPFMIVAGDHAVNDMAGDSADSWVNICRAAGYETSCILKGLGEYPDIQNIFIKHLKRAMDEPL